MKEWKYLIGSADDFIGAPEWATKLISGERSGRKSFVGCDEGITVVASIDHPDDAGEMNLGYLHNVIAQRTESFGNAIDLEFCKANPDHPDCKCKEGNKVADTFIYKVELDLSELQLPQSEVVKGVTASEKDALADKLIARMEIAKAHHLSSKYSRTCKGITLDVYDVLQAFAVTNPATQHAIKKLLCAGLRGHKDKTQDLTEALKSIERAIELEKE